MTEPGTEGVPAPDDAIEVAVQALRGKLTASTERIEQLEAELRKERDERAKVGRGLAALDPTWPGLRPKRANKPTKPQAQMISKERVDQYLAYLRQTYGDGKAFSVPIIQRDPNAPSWHRSQLTAGLHVLRDRGYIRLDHFGGPRSSGATSNREQFFKLTQTAGG